MLGHVDNTWETFLGLQPQDYIYEYNVNVTTKVLPKAHVIGDKVDLGRWTQARWYMYEMDVERMFIIVSRALHPTKVKEEVIWN